MHHPDDLSAEAKFERLLQRLRLELEQRTVIGQAAGMLVERYQLTPAQAFEFLDAKAREGERDVLDVAQEIVSEDHPSGDEAAGPDASA